MLLLRIPRRQLRKFRVHGAWPLQAAPRLQVNEIILVEVPGRLWTAPSIRFAARFSHLQRDLRRIGSQVFGREGTVLLHIAAGWELDFPFRLPLIQGSNRDYSAPGEFLYLDPEDEMLLQRNRFLGTRFAGPLLDMRLTDEEALIRERFHTLWSKSVGTPDYVKDEWKELGSLLRRKGIET
jgi:hypothetical protein